MTGFNERIVRIVPRLLAAVFCGAFSFPAFAQVVGGGDAPAGTPGSTVSAKAAGLGEGRGFSLSEDGNSRLHLRFDTGAGFDTNPYSLNFESNFGANGGAFNGDVPVRMRPGLELDMPGNVFALTLESSADLGAYPGAFNPGIFTGWFDENADQGTRQLSLIKINNNIDIEVNRDGMFSFALGDSFNFSRDPQVLSFAVGNVLSNSLRMGGGFRPGGGALSIKGDASFDLAVYIPCEGVAILGCPTKDTTNNDDFNSGGLRANLRADYRFLPRTGFFAEFSAGAHGYLNTLTGTGSQPYTVPLHLRVGAKGQFSSKLSGLASIGYDLPLIFDSGFNLGLASTFAGGVNLGNVGQVTAFNAQIEARWRISHSIKLSGGFQRTVMPTPVFQYRIPNKLYVSYQQAIGTFLTVTANAELALVQYGADINAGTPNSVVDTNSENGFLSLEPSMKFGVAYHIFDWMSVGINNNFIYHSGLGMQSKATTGGTGEVDFVRNETLVMLSIHY
ncbi:MAG: outer membrane beta-barrel protein [Deltaproteobacteria bacterium]|nr:outer membrane beta-barrel protein [Deltaproteobacteria bacterium]